MVLLSQFPIDAAAARTFQRFLYKDMPTALLPKDPETGLPWYSTEDLEVCSGSSCGGIIARGLSGEPNRENAAGCMRAQSGEVTPSVSV